MTKTYSTTDLAAVLRCTITNIRDRLERANVAPIHTRVGASGRVSRLYGQDAYDLVAIWATQSKARKAASKARATAKAQRKLARELKSANEAAELKAVNAARATRPIQAPSTPAGGQPTKLDRITSRLDALDAKLDRALGLLGAMYDRTFYSAPVPAPVLTQPNTGDAPYPWPYAVAGHVTGNGADLAYDEPVLDVR